MATSDGPALRRYAVGTWHKPGIVALRPLSASDVLDAATALVRRDPGPVLALSALVNAAAVLPAFGLIAATVAGGWFTRTAAGSVVDVDTAVAMLLAGAPLAATAVLSGLLGPFTEQAVLGRRSSFGSAWAAARPSLGALLAAATLVLGGFVGPWVLAVAAVALVASAPVPVVLVVGTVAALAASTATLALLPRVALTGPAVTLERRGPVSAVRRAVALSRGRYWSLLGVGVLAFGIGLVLFLGLVLVTLVAGSLTVDLLDLDSVRGSADRFVTAASILVAATLVTPFLAGCAVLQYVDARMRTEGLDLVLRAAASRARGQR